MRRKLFFIPFIVILASCGRTPDPTGYNHSFQRVMKASHHWNVLAADLADEINNQLILSDYMNKAVYVRETCGDENTPCEPQNETVFNESFRDLLITNLVNLGVPTSSGPTDDAIIVNYKAQTVYHRREWYQTIEPGYLTILASGVLVLRNAPWELITIATAGAIDFTHTFYGDRSNFEVIITTSLIDNDRYLYRNSNIYYINDMDAWHYQTPAKPSEIALTAGAPVPLKDDAAEIKTKQDVELPRPIITEPQSSPPTGI